MTAPCAAAGIAREPVRTGGEFVLNGHGIANRVRTRHIVAENKSLFTVISPKHC